ncbi:NAD(P)-dependent oxidoreductase [Acidithiobacillus thiooxidans]|nr:NAD(P)-dependent oxidoreductase [Acidithiobacillus thiooxidans]MDR7927856.1 NAD(P)-dependent oxidoreductase [Acidithiobacillus thiooxidans]
MSRKIAMTGATGFVGRQILRALIKQELNVRIIKRPSSQLPDWANRERIECVEVSDLFSASQPQLESLVSGCDTLIHAAWYAVPGEYLYSFRNVDCLIGTLLLAQAFQGCGGKRFIGIGTCFEYDVDVGRLKPDSPLLPKTPYAAAKVSSFQMLSQTLNTTDLSFAWCRLFYLYGEDEDPRRLVSYVRAKLGAGEPVDLGSGKQIRDFLDVQTAGNLVAEVALSDYRGPLNICSGQPVTVREIVERLADEYGRRDLLRFGVRPDNTFDPPCVFGLPWEPKQQKVK